VQARAILEVLKTWEADSIDYDQRIAAAANIDHGACILLNLVAGHRTQFDGLAVWIVGIHVPLARAVLVIAHFERPSVVFEETSFRVGAIFP
jgi:hypothetical protein